MKILLTGAAGFVGQHVRRLLIAHDHHVLTLDCLLPQVHGTILPGSAAEPEWLTWRATVENAALQRNDAIWDVDAVIHLAAEVGVAQSQYEPAKYVRANAYETALLWERIIERSRHIRQLVIASSMAIYGEGEYSATAPVGGSLKRNVTRGWNAFDYVANDGKVVPLPDELKPIPTREAKRPEPASVYAASKYHAEQYSMILGEAYRVPTVALRFFNIYGSGQALGNPYTGVLSSFGCRLLNGQPALINEDGQQLRDFVHVSDVVRAVVMAVESDGTSGVFNVGTGLPTSVLGLAEEWNRVAQSVGLTPQEPVVTRNYRSGDIRHAYADASLIHRVLGWSARVELKDGLKEAAAWIVQQAKPIDRTYEATRELRERALVRELPA